MTSILTRPDAVEQPERKRTSARTAKRTIEVRPVVRFRRSRPDLLCGVLLVAILIVQGWNISRFPALSDDEGTYLAQAWSVQQGNGLAHYTSWYDHPPVGWIQIAVLTWLPALIAPESMTVGTMRVAMLAVSAASAVLLYVLARRLWLPRWSAGLAMLLFGLSPLSVVLQREVFLDDSDDDTPRVIADAAQDCPSPVSVVHRETPEGGLGGAVGEGIEAAASERRPWSICPAGSTRRRREPQYETRRN